jgi:hypothetical protein
MESDSLANNARIRNALPMIISENGTIGEPILEVIYCSKVSADTFDNMPRTITLVRENKEGIMCERSYILTSEAYTLTNQVDVDNEYRDWLYGARGEK